LADVISSDTSGHVEFGAFARTSIECFIALPGFRQHAIDLRLLQHDFGNENVVRVVGLAPRQIAAVAAVPGQQPLPETAAIGRDRQRERARASVLLLDGHFV
jgi:hypothetical protein